MKTATWLAALMLTAALPSALAQELAKFRYCHHPSYSTRNYKQPDRAALSKKAGHDRGHTVSLTQAKRTNPPVMNRNYKHQFPALARLTYQGGPSKTLLEPGQRIG